MALATGKLTEAQTKENIEALAAINRVEKLTKAVNDGEVAQEDLAAAILNDGVVSLKEFNRLMGITGETTGIAEKEVYGLIAAESELRDTQGGVQSSVDGTKEAMGRLREQVVDAKWEAYALQSALIAASGNYSASFTTTFKEIRLETQSGSTKPEGPQPQEKILGTHSDWPTPSPPDWKFQHGGGFTVPGGYPNDSFYAPMRLSSGEQVEVTPKGDSAKGQVVVNIYNPQIQNETDIDDMARQVSEVIQGRAD